MALLDQGRRLDLITHVIQRSACSPPQTCQEVSPLPGWSVVESALLHVAIEHRFALDIAIMYSLSHPLAPCFG
jgi:hypothetical protein